MNDLLQAHLLAGGIFGFVALMFAGITAGEYRLDIEKEKRKDEPDYAKIRSDSRKALAVGVSPVLVFLAWELLALGWLVWVLAGVVRSAFSTVGDALLTVSKPADDES